MRATALHLYVPGPSRAVHVEGPAGPRRASGVLTACGRSVLIEQATMRPDRISCDACRQRRSTAAADPA